MRSSRPPPKNPVSNQTQKVHERMEQESIMKKALMVTDNAGPFFEEFQRKFNFKPNLKLKVSLTMIAGSLLANPIRPNRTEYRHERCLYYFINAHWEDLGPILNSLNAKKLGKGAGYEISNDSQIWQADAIGKVSIPFPDQSQKRAHKRDLPSRIVELTNEKNCHVDQSTQVICQQNELESIFSPFDSFDSDEFSSCYSLLEPLD